MKYLNLFNNFHKINEAKAKTYSKNIINDLCVAILLMNPNFLDDILDRGIRNRYIKDSNVFVNDLKNILFGNNKLVVGEMVDGVCIEFSEQGVINNYFMDITNNFEIESNWTQLKKSREISHNISKTLLEDSTINPENISKVYWLAPTKKHDNKIDLVIEDTIGKQYNIVINKKIGLSKTQSFSTFLDLLIGETYSNLLYSEAYQDKWDKLTSEWVRIVYDNATNETKLMIEKFIIPDRIYSMSNFDYKSKTNNNPNYAKLGEYFEVFDKNITHLSELMSNIYKTPSCFKDAEKVYLEWTDVKNIILNSRIIEYLFESTILSNEKDSEDESLSIASDNIKKNFVKLLIETLGIQEEKLYFYTKDTKWVVPGREFFRERLEELNIKYDFHVELLGESKEDYHLKVKLFLNRKILDMNCIVKFTGGEMSGRLSTVMKFELASDFNEILSE